MANRNDYNYFDDYGSKREYSNSNYRKRQPNHRSSAYIQKRNSKRLRNRIIIVSCGILIIALIVFLFGAAIKFLTGGLSQTNASADETVSTETAPSGGDSSIQPTVSDNAEADIKDELSPLYFKKPVIEDDNTNGTLNYGIYVWNKTAFELFGGSQARAEAYAEAINGFASKFDSSVKVYDMIIPNHTEMGLPERIKTDEVSSSSQAENIKAVYEKLTDRVTPINCYNYLADHNNEYIYFKSDHHWTGLGAYYAYSAFADTNKLDVLDLKACTENKIEGFTGSFMNNVSGVDSDVLSYWTLPYDVQMEITYKDGGTGSYDGPYYKYATSGSNTYGVFIMGDNPLTVLKSGSEKAQEGKKIAIIKESYGNALVPYFTYNYEEVHVIDFRYFPQNLVQYCKDNGIGEVLFANGVMSANTQVQLDKMSALFN